jgi:hypothetical protein
MWQGFDLHCVNDRHDKFYRIIRCSGTVFVRFGRRGAVGQCITKEMSAYGARAYVEQQCSDKQNYKHYHVVHHEELGGRPRELADYGEITGDAIEEAYLKRWRNECLMNYGAVAGQWAVFGGLLKVAKVDPVAGFVLDELKENICVFDAARDLVLGRINSEHIASGVWSGVTLLGLADRLDDEKVASTALSLYRPDNPAMGRIFPTARRLVSAS